ncbi:MAG TPA: glutathione S-transferase family protein [Candidatus Polarisedimenticolia bacterium]|nr:glutathione S-transferase family protein [Candidatus Polarisedimenticolia bacterium]
MSRSVKLYDLAPSPHNIKVRLALAYKKIPYEKIAVDGMNREPVVKVSGQPLTPVLVHGDSVVYDSYAITRYLDANWPSPPRLYSADRATMQKIEEWESFARNEATPPVGICFGEAFARAADPARLKKANDMINRAASRVEESLARTPYLMGESPNAADFALAPMFFYGTLPDSAAKLSPIHSFFHKNLHVEGSPRTREWVGRLMALES